MSNPEIKSILIQNKKGLHARAASAFVKTAEQFEASIFVEKDDIKVCGTSIMGLMMLAAAKGSEIKIIATGSQASQAIQSLTELINNKFGEAE